jgi:DegV family protein with EDD domain
MIHILTDSTCEAPAEVLARPGVHVVPLSVVFGQQALRDGVEITREEFWKRLPASNPLPTTSQATPGDFTGPFQRHTDEGDEVLAVVLSSKLSGTYDSAIQALADFSGRPIDVFDSRSVAVGLGLMVQVAAEMRDAGASRQEIVAKLEHMRDTIRLMFALDTLEYLQRGGRIGRAQALVGTLLKFKPLLALERGEVVPAARVRTRKKAIETLLDTLTHQISARGQGVRLAVTHAEADEDAAQMASALRDAFQTSHVFVSTLGPVVGVHVGPGVVGAAVYPGQ